VVNAYLMVLKELQFRTQGFSLLFLDVISDTQVKDPYHMQNHPKPSSTVKDVYHITNDFMQKSA